MKEEFDLENGNSDELYSELSQALGVSIPQVNVPYQSSNLQESASIRHGSPFTYNQRNGSGLTIVTQPQNGGSTNSHNKDIQHETSQCGTGEQYPHEKQDQDQYDSHSIRNRRPEQLQQRDLDKAKAERMEKRKRHRRLSQDDNDKHCQCPSIWTAFSRMVTCCFPPPLLVLLGKGLAICSQVTSVRN